MVREGEYLRKGVKLKKLLKQGKAADYIIMLWTTGMTVRSYSHKSSETKLLHQIRKPSFEKEHSTCAQMRSPGKGAEANCFPRAVVAGDVEACGRVDCFTNFGSIRA